MSVLCEGVTRRGRFSSVIETCFQVLPSRGQVRTLRAALRAPWNASSLLIGRHQALRDARRFLP